MAVYDYLNGENKNLEFKVAMPTKAEHYINTFVAFANGNGGKLIVGIDDKTKQIVGVDDDILDRIVGVAGTFPLHSRGEAGASPPAEVRLFHFLQDLNPGHLTQGLAQGGIAAVGQIVIDAPGINFYVVADHIPFLIPV